MPTPTSPSDFAPLPADARTLLPEPGRVLNGIFVPQGSNFLASAEKLETFGETVGKMPVLQLVFYDWGIGWSNIQRQLDISDGLGITLMVGWEPRIFTQKTVLQAVIDGDEDSTIRNFAEGAKAYGKPIFLRWGHEMNGNWYPWSGDDNGDDPQQYVKAWRHLHEVMVKEIGAANIVWVWCPNAYSVPNETWNALEAYYPGDEYVDWVAVDFYGLMKGWGRTDPGPALDQVYKLFGDRKPVMIGESAAADPAHSDPAYGMTKPEWINAWFDAIETRVNVRAAVWFNINKEADWRVDSDPDSLAVYQSRLASERYLNP